MLCVRRSRFPEAAIVPYPSVDDGDEVDACETLARAPYEGRLRRATVSRGAGVER